MYYYFSIALTGAVVLGVEVLSSRILTPYFGVSLYIWASILTITLVCLAGGYYLGGYLTRKLERDATKVTFSLFVSLASIVLSLSAFLYPHIFPLLMEMPLVAGSLVASVVLMSIPLVLFSALNPIVMVLARKDESHKDESHKGDAGAGLVFFISTLGSVIGVIVTAFLFIPQFSNTVGLLVFALVAALLSLMGVWLQLRGEVRGRRAWVLAVCAVAGSVAFLVYETAFPKMSFVDKQGVAWNILDERHSMFGTIKVVDRVAGDGSLRFYVNDGLFQDIARQDGRSAVAFTYVLTSLLKQYAADAHSILFLGLAAGIVPQSFPASGYRTEIVEINPDSLDVAKRYFGLDDAGRGIHIQDARTFVNGCKGRFDAIVFDMFHGDGVPDYLLSQEFFQKLKQCGTEKAVLVMNLFEDGHESQVRNSILATISSAYANVAYFSDPATQDELRNGYVVASNSIPGFSKIDVQIPANLIREVNAVLSSGKRITPVDFSHAAPLADDHNIYSVLSATMNMRVRNLLRKGLPPELYKS